MALLLAAAQAVAMEEDSETDNLTIQEEGDVDDTSENGGNRSTNGAGSDKSNNSKLTLLKVRNDLEEVKGEIDDKGNALSQTFNELSNLLSSYNAMLSVREDNLRIHECENKWLQEAKRGDPEKLKRDLLEKEKKLSEYESNLKKTKSLLFHTQSELERKITCVTQKESELTSLQNDLRVLHSDLVRTQGQLSFKDTMIERLQVQMLQEKEAYNAEIAQLRSALQENGKDMTTLYPLRMEASSENQMESVNATFASNETTPMSHGTTSEDNQMEGHVEPIRIKEEPVDESEQILIQNTQTQQVTLLDPNNPQLMTGLKKVTPASLAHAATPVSNPGSMVTVYVQSTSAPIPEKPKKVVKPLNAAARLPTDPDPNQKFACSRCGKTFIEWLQLQKHLETHSGSKPYKCQYCDKTFRQKYVLDTHIRTHTGERPYRCEECYQSFGQKATLSNHMRIHTGERPYNCDVCDRSFAQLSSLQSHIRTHGRDKIIPCTICTKIFSDKPNYHRHLLDAHQLVGTAIQESVKIEPVQLISLASGSPVSLPKSPSMHEGDHSQYSDDTE